MCCMIFTRSPPGSSHLVAPTHQTPGVVDIRVYLGEGIILYITFHGLVETFKSLDFSLDA